MRRILPLLLFGCVAVFAQQQEDSLPPTDAELKDIVAKVTAKALQYGSELPNFACEKLTRHYLDISGTNQQWKMTGTTTEELTYLDHKATFKAVNGKGAASGDDEFGDLQTWIFDPKSKTEWKWNSWATMNKRRTYVLAYKVNQPESQFTIASKKATPVAFAGLIWGDAETGAVVRLSAVAQSPAGVQPQGVTLEATYDYLKVGDKDVLLPVKSEYRAKDGKSLVWNEAEFRKCR